LKFAWFFSEFLISERLRNLGKNYEKLKKKKKKPDVSLGI